MKNILKIIVLAIGTVVFAGLGLFRTFAAQCGEVSGEVLRLHIPANSDSEDDQRIKTQLRDFILEEYGERLSEAESLGQAQALCRELLPEIERSANIFLEERGVAYGAKAELAEMWFPTREYERLILPAGNYPALRITLGSGEGKNWWCVIFPRLCLPAVSSDGTDGAGERENALLETFGKPQKLKFRFAIYEWLTKRLPG